MTDEQDEAHSYLFLAGGRFQYVADRYGSRERGRDGEAETVDSEVIIYRAHYSYSLAEFYYSRDTLYELEM